MNVKTHQPVTAAKLARAEQRKAEGAKDGCGESLKVGDFVKSHYSHKPMEILGLVFEMPTGTTNRFGEDGGWYISARGYHIMANGCSKVATP